MRLVQKLDAETSEFPQLGGLQFPPGTSRLLVLDAESSGASVLFPMQDAGEPLVLDALFLSAPLNMAFDPATGRQIFLEPTSSEFLEIRLGADGRPDLATVRRSDASNIGATRPVGLSLDPASGRLFLLDAEGPRIGRVEPDPGRGLALGSAAADGRISWTRLQAKDLSDPAGLAFEPATGHLHVLSPTDERLYEFTEAGVSVAVRDLSGAGLRSPAGLLFAASADQTDASTEQHLYVAARGETTSSVAEFSLATAVAVPAAVTVVSALVQVIDTSAFDPPSPDSAGVTYLPGPGTLLVSDSEVNEMPIFEGVNVFEVDLGGSLLGTESTTGFSNEPTGVSFDADSGTLFFSDDTGTASIYLVSLGNDNQFGTADDSVSEFSTEAFGSDDAEGVSFGDGALYVADGVNNEIYRVAPGNNGVFDGVPPAGDDSVSQFDTKNNGILDPEGVAFNPDTGNLYVVGEPTNQVAEFTPQGSLVQLLDISAANAVAPAGLAYAPSSVASGLMNLYVAARGVDNNSDPNENDGKVYELTLPLPVTCSSNTDCDDGVFCNGLESCVSSVCQTGSEPCPGQGCDEASQTCLICDFDGTCDPGEDCGSCPSDCIGASAGCGNAVCEPNLGESCLSCADDCSGKQNGRLGNRYCCGDGGGTNPVGCEDNRCSTSGELCSDVAVGGYCCGDETCEGIEDTGNCAVDCGVPPACGDGSCEAGEDLCSCSADCGVPPATESLCADGLDDDCDGLVDGADPDCCNLSQKGDTCSSDGDCCSNRCRGKSGAKTCK